MDVPWNLSSFLEAEYPSGDFANSLVVKRVVDMGNFGGAQSQSGKAPHNIASHKVHSSQIITLCV